MLTSAAGIEDLVEALEVRFLANRDPSLYFALLTDFGDAAQESLVADAPLLALAEAKIAELNEKYGGDATNLQAAGDDHRYKGWPQENGSNDWPQDHKNNAWPQDHRDNARSYGQPEKTPIFFLFHRPRSACRDGPDRSARRAAPIPWRARLHRDR